MKQVLEELTKAPEDGEQKMLCTIIEKHGSAPRSAGTQMVAGPAWEVWWDPSVEDVRKRK